MSTFQGKQLSSCFNIKDKQSFRISMIWFTTVNVLKKVAMINMSTKRQDSSDRVLDHSGGDKNSHILKQQIEREHPCPQYENFKVISSGFRNNTKERKLSEVLWINTHRPSLNKQEKTISLKLFN